MKEREEEIYVLERRRISHRKTENMSGDERESERTKNRWMDGLH